MQKLLDGRYLTRPKNSPQTETNVRVITIHHTLVLVKNHTFCQDDFFKVNDLLFKLPSEIKGNIMKHEAGIWQAESGTVFKLKETGKSKRVDDKWVPELINDVMFRVNITNDPASTGPAMAMKENLLAEQIAKLLNEHPLP